VLSDWELWAVAATVENEHGAHAPVFVAERIGVLVLAGDAAGVEAWKAIAQRLAKLAGTT
jgi:hypothetical protein